MPIQMLQSVLKPEQGLSQVYMHSRLQIVALPLEILVIQLHYLDIDTAGAYINELVCSVLVLDDMPVGCTFLHPNE